MEEFRSQYIPRTMEKQLEFMDFNRDGHMLLGCSNLTGRFWVGSLWYYKDPSEAPSVSKAFTGLDCDNGVVEGFFVGHEGKNILVALDNGSIELLTMSESKEDPEKSFHFLERVKTVQEHDDIITGMTTNADKTKVITSSYDKSLVALDIETLALSWRCDKAHDDLVSNVAANALNVNIIASSGNDGRVLLWDLRETRDQAAAGCVLNDPSVWPTCVSWSPSSEHLVVVGNQGGDIQMFDIRQYTSSSEATASSVAADTDSLNRPIYRIKFNPKLRPNTFAVSADNIALHVFELDESMTKLNIRYCDKRHDDFIRGLSWHPTTDDLYTCGWDQQVLVHSF